MAAASQQKYLTVKLGFLTERRDQLFSVVNDQVNKVLDLGKSWIEGKRENDDGKVLSYKEISNLVEDTDMLLAQQVDQLAGGDQEYVVTDTSSAATTTSSSLVTVAASQTSENQIQQTTTPTVAARDKKLYTVIQDVADLVPKVSHLENQIQQTITPTLAVRAGVINITPVKGNIIDKWRCVAGNTGGHFDVNTGIFTAPVAGTYAVALCMAQVNEGKIGLYINKTPSGRNPSVNNDRAVAGAITDRGDTTNCGFSVVDMSVGEKFYVCVAGVDQSPTLGVCRFSIFLIK